MPFWYHIPVTTPESGCKVVRLVRWLVEDEAEVHAGTSLAILEGSAGRFALLANGDGFIRERLFREGAELETGTPIAIVIADGDRIPYEKPYSLAQRIEE